MPNPPADRRGQPRRAARAVMAHRATSRRRQAGRAGATLFTEDSSRPARLPTRGRTPDGAGDSFAGERSSATSTATTASWTRPACDGDGLRRGARLLQRRAVRHRARRRPAPATRSTSASPAGAMADPLRPLPAAAESAPRVLQVRTGQKVQAATYWRLQLKQLEEEVMATSRRSETPAADGALATGSRVAYRHRQSHLANV